MIPPRPPDIGKSFSTEDRLCSNLSSSSSTSKLQSLTLELISAIEDDCAFPLTQDELEGVLATLNVDSLSGGERGLDERRG